MEIRTRRPTGRSSFNFGPRPTTQKPVTTYADITRSRPTNRDNAELRRPVTPSRPKPSTGSYNKNYMNKPHGPSGATRLLIGTSNIYGLKIKNTHVLHLSGAAPVDMLEKLKSMPLSQYLHIGVFPGSNGFQNTDTPNGILNDINDIMYYLSHSTGASLSLYGAPPRGGVPNLPSYNLKIKQISKNFPRTKFLSTEPLFSGEYPIPGALHQDGVHLSEKGSLLIKNLFH